MKTLSMSLQQETSLASSSVRATTAADRYRLGLLSFAHAVSDSYGFSLLSPLFPVLKEQLHLSLAMVGSLPTVIGISASLAQPVLGYLSDKVPRLPLVAVGPIVGALFCGLVGFAPSHAVLLCFLFLAGVGIGAFHPQGARLANVAGKGSGLAMSAFTVGGNVGFGLAPLMGAFYFRYFGLEHWYVSAIPGIISGIVLGCALNRAYPERVVAMSATRDANRNNVCALGFLTASVTLRALIPVGMTAYLPFHVQQHGLPGLDIHTAKAVVVSALLLSNGFAGPFGGYLSDRFGRKCIMLGSFLLAPWPLLAAFHLPGYLGVFALAVGGFVLMLPHPGNVVMAQEFMPNNASVAASMIMGLAWGLAVLMTMPLGAIADHVGVSPMLQGICIAQLAGVLLALPIPER